MGWNEIIIENRIFCNNYISSKEAINVIVTHTPIFSTTYVQAAYEPLINYGVNVFAIDFSCTGSSKGSPKEFSLEKVVQDMRDVIAYIEENFSANIHVFGNTGIGGIFAQVAVCENHKVKSFAQFACANYKDTSILGMPLVVAKATCSVMKLVPNMNFSFKEPKYKGYRAKEDNEVYENLEKILPNFRKCKMSIMSSFLECIVSDKSILRRGVQCPTLVFKTMHDRYFKTDYFDKYYNHLNCEKKLVEIEDVHNSYLIAPDVFCSQAVEWFKLNQ